MVQVRVAVVDHLDLARGERLDEDVLRFLHERTRGNGERAIDTAREQAQSKASDRIVTHQIAVDDFVLVQRDERAEALPSDLLHALHLLDGAAVIHRGVGAGVGAGGSRAPPKAHAAVGRTVKYFGSRHSSIYL